MKRLSKNKEVAHLFNNGIVLGPNFLRHSRICAISTNNFDKKVSVIVVIDD